MSNNKTSNAYGQINLFSEENRRVRRIIMRHRRSRLRCGVFVYVCGCACLRVCNHPRMSRRPDGDAVSPILKILKKCGRLWKNLDQDLSRCCF